MGSSTHSEAARLEERSSQQEAAGEGDDVEEVVHEGDETEDEEEDGCKDEDEDGAAVLPVGLPSHNLVCPDTTCMQNGACQGASSLKSPLNSSLLHSFSANAAGCARSQNTENRQ